MPVADLKVRLSTARSKLLRRKSAQQDNVSLKKSTTAAALPTDHSSDRGRPTCAVVDDEDRSGVVGGESLADKEPPSAGHLLPPPALDHNLRKLSPAPTHASTSTSDTSSSAATNLSSATTLASSPSSASVESHKDVYRSTLPTPKPLQHTLQPCASPSRSATSANSLASSTRLPDLAEADDDSSSSSAATSDRARSISSVLRSNAPVSRRSLDTESTSSIAADDTKRRASSNNTSTSSLRSTPHRHPVGRKATVEPRTAATGGSMTHRKIWVKKAGASATMVRVRDGDLVDDVRDAVLKKYANSIGRSFDAPDVAVRVYPRNDKHRSPDRVLDPDEDICAMLDECFPNGQTVDDALVVETPQRRTPKPSPRGHHSHHNRHHSASLDEGRPLETGSDYFPLMPPALSPSLPVHERAMSVLNTGQVPPLPSPGGGGGGRRGHHGRPRNPRAQTTSPNTPGPSAASLSASLHLGGRSNPRTRGDSAFGDGRLAAAPSLSPLPTPPAPEAVPSQLPTSPGPRLSSPRPGGEAKKRRRKPVTESSPAPPSLLDSSVPPINCLIVEDNIINLKLLEAFMKRLKVRWQTAMNGRDAVKKWREGGFHLVLMDIQLPIMSGLEATREIRRLERVNNIGVFSSTSSASSTAPSQTGPPSKDETSESTNGVDKDSLDTSTHFKSPVIIVALTASSLQSDRHEALGAGCNDFLTKPVNFAWLQRKVKEWGCMQALIDFDGWRKWKDFSAAPPLAIVASAAAGDGSTITTAKEKIPGQGRAHKRSTSNVPPIGRVASPGDGTAAMVAAQAAKMGSVQTGHIA